MNIYTVRDNLKNTIAGKEAALARLCGVRDRRQWDNLVSQAATLCMIQVLEMNLRELATILKDVEVCCKQATEDSWRGDDRQMGA